MLKDDIRIVEGAMRGNDLLFNYEIAAWNRIKKYVKEAGEQRPTEQNTPCEHAHTHVEKMTSGSICDDCGEEL